MNNYSRVIPTDGEEKLARELAKALDDERNLAFYRYAVTHYPEAFLRKTLSIVKDVPYEKIRKSRGALFNYLLHQYGAESQSHYRH